MASNKVIPIGHTQSAKERLIDALGDALAKNGFNGLDAGAIAAAAGVDRKVLFRYFSGLPDLIAAFGRCSRFWPSAEEILGGDEAVMKNLSPAQQISGFFKGFLRGVMNRPKTLDIMAWELVERERFSGALEQVRVRAALEYFERLHGDVPEDIDLSAIVALLGGGVMYLAVRSRQGGHFGGLNMWDDQDRERIEGALDLLLGSLFSCAPPSGSTSEEDE